MEDKQKKRWAKWMGWKYYKNGLWWRKYKTGTSLQSLDDWNPDSPNCPHSVWVEIWERMNRDEMGKYMDELKKLCVRILPWSDWEIHTTTPEVRTKALDEVIK